MKGGGPTGAVNDTDIHRSFGGGGKFRGVIIRGGKDPKQLYEDAKKKFTVTGWLCGSMRDLYKKLLDYSKNVS